MPVCKPNQRSAPAFRLPGTNDRPLPLISYTETSYFGRCLALLMGHAKAAPALRLHYESDMAEVVKKLVLEGEGVAWLPKSSIAAELDAGELVPAGQQSGNSKSSFGCTGMHRQPQRIAGIALASSSRSLPASPDRVVPRYAKLA